jgi:hypothetical protein
MKTLVKIVGILAKNRYQPHLKIESQVISLEPSIQPVSLFFSLFYQQLNMLYFIVV